MFVRNCWYVAAWSDELGRQPLAQIYLNEPVVLFRKEDGTPVAMEDRCPHRRAPLSRGKVVGDCIQCGYHGFVFDADGTCIEVPGQDRIPPGADIRVYPLVERHKLIWIWMGDPEKADPNLIHDHIFERLDHPNWRAKGERLHLKCNYMLLVENLLDMLHLAFVHTTTIGNPSVSSGDVDTKITRGDDFVRAERWIMDQPPPPAFAAAGGFEGNIDRWHVANFAPPSSVRIDVGGAVAGSGARNGDYSQAIQRHNINAVTPETETTTHYFWADANDSWEGNQAITERFFKQVHTAFLEDIDILEAQQRTIEFDPDAPEVDLAVDAAGLHGRRIVQDMVASEAGASSRPTGRIDVTRSTHGQVHRRDHNAPLEFYAFTTPNCWKVSIMLEEIEANYAPQVIRMPEGEHKSDEYLALNPIGKVPFLVDHETGASVFGSGTILLYLAEKSGQFLPQRGHARSEVLDQLMFASTDLGVFNQFLLFTRVLPQKDEYAIGIFQGEIDRLTNVMEDRLATRDYLASEYSIADMAAFPFFGGVRKDADFLKKHPNIGRWVENIEARPAVQNGLKVPALD